MPKLKQKATRRYRKRTRKTSKLTKPQVSQVKKIIAGRLEDGYFDHNSNSYLINYASGPNVLVNCPQGDTVGGHTKDQITMTSMGLHYNFRCIAPAAGDPPVLCRALLIRMNDVNAVAPVIGDILEYTSGVFTFQAVMSPYNYQNVVFQRKYTILHDKIVTVGYQNQIYSGYYKTSKKQVIRFTPGSATAGEGMLYFFMISSNPATGTLPTVTVDMHSRCYYKDG